MSEQTNELIQGLRSIAQNDNHYLDDGKILLETITYLEKLQDKVRILNTHAGHMADVCEERQDEIVDLDRALFRCSEGLSLRGEELRLAEEEIRAKDACIKSYRRLEKTWQEDDHIEYLADKLEKAREYFKAIKESRIIPIGKNARTLIEIDNICDEALDELGESDD